MGELSFLAVILGIFIVLVLFYATKYFTLPKQFEESQHKREEIIKQKLKAQTDDDFINQYLEAPFKKEQDEDSENKINNKPDNSQ